MPLNPVPNFPTSLDSLPDPTTTTYTDDDGFELDLLLQKHNAILELLEAILGTGITATNGVMRKIAVASGTGASGVIEFSSIPQTYRALFLLIVGRTDAAVTSTGIRMTYETAPTAGAYNHQILRGNGTAASAQENIGASDFMNAGSVVGTTGPANAFGYGTITIPEYANTSLFKGFIAQSLVFTALSASGGFSDMFGGLWESTAAIDRIRLTLGSGNWTTTSRVTLYGIPT